MLHLTNGDSAAGLIRRTGVTGEVIPWRDILHEGPVPSRLALEAMSDVRARFLASTGAGTFAELRRAFGARDAALRGARTVALWFEHDLHDQLQLIQILATLATQPETTAELICIGSFPGILPFYGLGQLTPVQLASLWPARRRVTREQLALGARAWAAFSSSDPIALRRCMSGDLTSLIFLRPALERFLDEFPTAPDGLARTERQLLRIIARDIGSFGEVFVAQQAEEPAPFLGDTRVRARLDALINARTPLLTPEPYALTPAGQRVLAGELDARQLNGSDRWLGGVHLTG